MFGSRRVRGELNRTHPGTPELIEHFVGLLVNEYAQVGAERHCPLLLGPPGTGKTKFVKDYARTLGREFSKIDLGGLNDPHELRGFHATYLNSRPGHIINALVGCETTNPIILLDEIDKTGTHRGQVQDVFLALLDPDYHGVFIDGYLDIPYDMSTVTWVASANSLEGIRMPLLDRLYVIELPGYSAEQKLAIARDALLPEILGTYGFGFGFGDSVDIPEAVLERLVELNQGDPSLRTLRKWLQSLVTKSLVANLEGIELGLTPSNVASLLGLDDLVERERQVPGSYL